MAFAFVSRAAATGSNTCAYGANNVSGNLLVVCAQGSESFGALAISDTQSNTWTLRGTAGNAGSNVLKIWSAVAGSSGANTVTVAPGFGNTNRIAVFEFSGQNATPFDATGNSTGGTPPASCTVTTTAANDLIVGFSYAVGAATFSSGTSGYTSDLTTQWCDEYNLDVGASGGKTLNPVGDVSTITQYVVGCAFAIAASASLLGQICL